MMNTIAIETAYNVSVEYQLATVWDRIWAYVIDIVIKIVYASLAGTLAFNIGFESYILYGVLGLPFIFYSLIFETFNNGQTPGKTALQVQVVSLDGKNLRFGQLVIRWILRLIDMWIFSFSIAFLAVVSTRKAQRLGDIVAGTTVISLKDKESTKNLSRVKLPDNFVGKYKQVLTLKDTDIEFLKSLVRNRTEAAHKLQVEAATHLNNVLGIEKEGTSKEFLKKIVYEYNYHQMVEEGLIDEEE